ncbi:MAG: hypothetical protein ACJ79D_09750 [Myxococcales bacterium]
MIRPCSAADLPTVFAIVNDAAEAYRGVIPADRWHEPYMPLDELGREIRGGVAFWDIPERQIETSVVLANRAWTVSPS